MSLAAADLRETPLATLPARRPTVTIFSYHVYEQHRRGGMHFLCDAFRALGWNARFVTCDYSLATLVKGDRRTRHGKARGFNRLVPVADDLAVGVVFTPFHAVGRASGVVRRLADRLTRSYPWPRTATAGAFAQGSDLVIVESCGGLMFVDAIRAASDAPIVYRVSDNLDVIRPVPGLLAAEARAAGLVDAISLASPHLARRFEGHETVRLDPMGLDKAQFDLPSVSPYPEDGRRRVVISGSSSFDHEAAAFACDLLPDWDFYQIGSLNRPIEKPNFKALGERPFSDVVRYVAHADIGFAPYLARPGVEYQADHSNRLLQYVYCRLPSVVPMALCHPGRPHFLGYAPGDDASLHDAFLAAEAYDRAAVPRQDVIDWRELALRLASVERKGGRP